MYYRSLSIVAVVGLSFGLCACSPKATQNDLNAQNSALPDSANAPSPSAESAKTGDSAQADSAPTEPKGILCEEESCACGKMTCGRNSRCDDGFCTCGSERYAFSTDLYVCEDGQFKCIGTGGFDSCDCGSTVCSVGTHCVGGNTCTCRGKKPTDEVAKSPQSWRCIGDTWQCYAGSLTNEQGCECGGVPNKCGAKTTCIDGRCMCGDEVFDLDAAEYSCEDGKITCGKSEGCQCGKGKCGQGGTCRDGKCTCGDSPWKFATGTYCYGGKVARW